MAWSDGTSKRRAHPSPRLPSYPPRLTVTENGRYGHSQEKQRVLLGDVALDTLSDYCSFPAPVCSVELPYHIECRIDTLGGPTTLVEPVNASLIGTHPQRWSDDRRGRHGVVRRWPTTCGKHLRSISAAPADCSGASSRAIIAPKL